MALTPAELIAKYNSSLDGKFKPNTTQAIVSATMRLLVSDLADMFDAAGTGGGGGSPIGTSVQSVGLLNFLLLQEFIFKITGVGAPITITKTGDENALKYDLIVEITNIAGVLTFPSNYKSSDPQWEIDEVESTWTPSELGLFRGDAVLDGTDWLLRLNGPFVEATGGGGGGGGGVFDDTFDDTFS